MVRTCYFKAARAIAPAFSRLKRWRTILVACALLTPAVYTVAALGGGVLPVKALISFDLLVRVSTPIVVIILILNGR
jgi:hypothetical protein